MALSSDCRRLMCLCTIDGGATYRVFMIRSTMGVSFSLFSLDCLLNLSVSTFTSYSCVFLTILATFESSLSFLMAFRRPVVLSMFIYLIFASLSSCATSIKGLFGQFRFSKIFFSWVGLIVGRSLRTGMAFPCLENGWLRSLTVVTIGL